MSSPIVSYTIPPRVTLKEVADAASTSTERLRELNANLTGKTDSNIAGLNIRVQQTALGDGTGGDNHQISRNWLTEQELNQRLAAVTARGQSRERIANNPEVQRTEPGQVAQNSKCAECYYDMVHVSEGKEDGSKTHKLVLLTRAESEAFAEEEKLIQDAINKFNQGLAAISEQADAETVRVEKKRLFDELVTTVPDVFHKGQSGINQQTGEKIPAGDPDPTPIIEVRRLGAIPTADRATATSEVAIVNPTPPRKEEPTIKDTPNSFLPMAPSSLVFNYVRGQTLKEVIDNGYRVYNIPSQSVAPWWNNDTKKINTERLKQEIQRIRDTKFDRALELKIQMEPIVFFNNSAYEWKDETIWPLESINIDIKVSREVQVFRMVSNASAEAGYDVLKRTATVSAKANAEFDLISGQAKIESEFPKGENAHLVIDMANNQQIDFGYFHFKVELIVMGFAGASAMACADIQADFSSGIPKIKATTPYNDAARVGVEAFAGVRAGCELKGALEWIDTLEPEVGRTDPKWKQLAEAMIEGQIAAGVGGSAKFYIQFNNGTFSIMAHAGLVWGVGASGKIGGTVRLDNIYVMVHFVYNSLMKVDYSYLDFMEENAFKKLMAMGLGLLIQGASWAINITTDMINRTADYVTNFINRLNEFFNNWSERKAILLAQHVLNDLNAQLTRPERSVILHLPPEGKGQILYKLLYINWPDFWFETPDEKPLQAVMALMRTIQSSREMRLVFACMNADGTLKHNETEKNFNKLMKYLKNYPAYKEELNQRHSTLSQREVMAAVELVKENIRTILYGDIQPEPDQPVLANNIIDRGTFAQLAKATNYRYYV